MCPSEGLFMLLKWIKFFFFSRHQHYKYRKSSLQDNPSGRRQSGGDVGVIGSGGSRRVSIQPEDATLEV